MNTQNQKNNNSLSSSRKNLLGGVLLLFIGVLFLLKESSFFYFPHWLFSWPMILIAIGIFKGVKDNFRGPGWLILLILGSIFLLDKMSDNLDLHRFLPAAIIIGIGLTMIFRPKKINRRNCEGWNNTSTNFRQDNSSETLSSTTVNNASQNNTNINNSSQPYTGEDYIDSTAVFGSVQKIVMSKNFKGGEITCFMAGTQIDLTQADITGTVILDITTVMGGAQLIVPSNWEIKSEISTVFGGMEDKRQVRSNVIDFNKVLVLKGTSFMGGIELKSF